MSATATVPTFKICVVGDANVGKTAYINRLRTGNFIADYRPTMGIVVTPLHVTTSKGSVRFNMWDCAGHDALTLFGVAYYIRANAFIVMVDGGDANVVRWIRDIRRVCPTAPILLVGNKADTVDYGTADTIGDYDFVAVSTKICRNFDGPIRSLLTVLMGADYVLDGVTGAEDA